MDLFGPIRTLRRDFWHGDCLELMRNIRSGSVDMVLCDLPYGTTACAWDSIIPFAPLWAEYKRVAKPNAAIVLTAAQPFTSVLIASNFEMFKYNLIWKKSNVSHFAQAPYRFLTTHEDIPVFSLGGCTKNSKIRMSFNPQGVKDTVIVRSGLAENQSEHRPGRKKQSSYIQTRTGYPKSILEFDSEPGFHPTQKPVTLFEYLIKTYTHPGETVLDNCAGSGTTAIAAMNTGRGFICIEKDADYFQRATERVARHA